MPDTRTGIQTLPELHAALSALQANAEASAIGLGGEEELDILRDIADLTQPAPAGFALDHAGAAAFLLTKYETDVVFGHDEDDPKTGATFTFEDVYGDDHPNKQLDDLINELQQAGIITLAGGWDIAIYPLDSDTEWGYLLTVRRGSHTAGPFLQVADLSDDVRISDIIVDTLAVVVDAANRLLPAARAAHNSITS